MDNSGKSGRREKLVIANFKANVINGQKQYVETLMQLINAGVAGAVGVAGAAGEASVLCVVCPSTPYISSFNEFILSGGSGDIDSAVGVGGAADAAGVGVGIVSVVCGAQSVSSALQGSYTGEVVAEMLADVGTKFAIVGHSEERAMLKRENDDIASAVKNCFNCGLGVVLCVSNETIDSLSGVIAGALRLLAGRDGGSERGDRASLSGLKLVVAYEPIDAINGASAAPADVRARFFNEIRAQIDALRGEFGDEFCDSIRLIYGGSADEITAKKIVDEDGIDGVIVGRATLDPSKIAKICLSLL